MSKNEAKDLFQLQTELVDMKVDMAVSNAIDRVVAQLTDLKNEMQGLRGEMHAEIHGLRAEMNKRFSSLENRMIAVETKLGIVNETQKEVHSRFIEYSFRALWTGLSFLGLYALTQLHHLI